jgi:hypothetical protein
LCLTTADTRSGRWLGDVLSAGGSNQTRFAPGHIGTAITQASPLACQQSCGLLPRPRTIASIIWVPKPLRVGGLTGGRRASVQRSARCPSSPCDHSPQTCPSRIEHHTLPRWWANSGRASATACAISGFSLAVGPSIRVRFPRLWRRATIPI